MTDAYVIGDLHGDYEGYMRLLMDAELINDRLDWCGGRSHLWQIGDFFDRGPLGSECVALTMKLQQQSQVSGGMVNALLGNHELMLLCAARFGQEEVSPGYTVRQQWRRWGGIEEDLANLSDAQLEWVSELPLMALVNDRLLIHADSVHYIDHGETIEAVNASFRELLSSPDLDRWESALSSFCEHEAFSKLAMSGAQKANLMLRWFGGSTIVHGHTPIQIAAGIAPVEVDRPWVYADGLCVNVDGGLYLGGKGFVYRFALDN